MAKFGCPNVFVNTVREFHDGMQARVSPRQRRILRAFPRGKRNQARLCPGTHSVQHDVLSHADRCIPFWRNGDRPALPHRRQAFQSAKTPGQDQSADNHSLRLPLRRRLTAHRNATNRLEMRLCTNNFATACSEFGLTHHQHKEDRGDAPTYLLLEPCTPNPSLVRTENTSRQLKSFFT